MTCLTSTHLPDSEPLSSPLPRATVRHSAKWLGAEHMAALLLLTSPSGPTSTLLLTCPDSQGLC